MTASKKNIAKIVAGLFALVLLFVLGRSLGGQIPDLVAGIEELGIWAPVVFVIVYALATVAFVPGSILTMLAGAVFGLAKGTLVVFIGATLGSIAAFLVCRYLARETIERRLHGHETFGAIDRAVGEEGLRIVSLLRLTPVIPFNLLNYALGLTQVRLRDYALASFAMLPGTFLYVYFGKVAGDIATVASGAAVQKNAAYWATLGLGLAATIAVTVIVTRIARKALRETTHPEP